MDPRLILEIARQLLLSTCKMGNRLSLPCGRSAVSRAYYGSYNVAVEFLAFAGIRPTSKHDSHSAVKNALIYSDDQMVREAGVNLESLHQKRKQADYEMGHPTIGTFKEADAACRTAVEIIEILDECHTDGVRFSKFRTNMREWAKGSVDRKLTVI